MEEVAKGFPQGVKFNIVYDRSELIQESVSSIKTTLMEEMIVVSVVVIIFLFHWRSAVKHHYPNSNYDCDKFYPLKCFWHYVQHYVLNRYRPGHRSNRG